METQPQATQTDTQQQRPRIRVSKVTLEGFKAFKEPFTLEIPPPLAVDDPDVLVIGSSNGVGKTSVLEGVMLALLVPEDDRAVVHLGGAAEQVLVNSGARVATVTCCCSLGSEQFSARSDLLPGFGYANGGDDDWPCRVVADYGVSQADRAAAIRAASQLTADPVVAPPVLYLHSYRAVRQRALGLQSLAGAERGSLGTASDRFKRMASVAVLAAAGGIEGVDDEVMDAPASLERLSRLVGTYAGGSISPRLQLDRQGSLCLTVSLPNGAAVPFDALSSGQKEIISTLFLIWEATRDCPSVVLIDEPELHLNTAWHDDIVRMLFELAPWNQYILATHSQRVAESVYPDRLRIIEPR